jgi:hypothetical protein
MQSTIRRQNLVMELQINNSMKQLSTNRVVNFALPFSCCASSNDKTAGECLYRKIEYVIQNAKGISHKGCSIWRKSKIAARLVRRIDMQLPLTKWQSVTAKVLADDESVEERLIEQALELYPIPRDHLVA